MWRVGQHNECVCMRHQTFSWECRQVCCSWKIVLEGVYSRQCPDVLFNVFIDFFSMCMWTCWHASVHMSLLLHVCFTGTFDLVNVNTCVFILYLCRACWLLNILSGHVKCERNRAQDVQIWPSACSQNTHSLTLSLSHLHARSLIFVSSLPPTLSSPLPVPLHCSSWHNGPIIVPFSSSVSSAHLVFV